MVLNLSLYKIELNHDSRRVHVEHASPSNDDNLRKGHGPAHDEEELRKGHSPAHGNEVLHKEHGPAHDDKELRKGHDAAHDNEDLWRAWQAHIEESITEDEYRSEDAKWRAS